MIRAPYTQHFLEWRIRTIKEDTSKIHDKTIDYIEFVYMDETGRSPFVDQERPKLTIKLSWVIAILITILLLTIFL